MTGPARLPFAAEAADPHCLRAGEAGRLLAGHPWRRFAVVGDSIAEGIGDASPGYRAQSWCDRIAGALREAAPALDYLNLGVRDTPAERVRARQLGPALDFRPDLALVACGGYDVLRFSYDGESVAAQVRAIVAEFARAGADLVTVAPFDGSGSAGIPAAFGRRMRRRLLDLAERTEAIALEFGAVHVGLTRHPASGDPGLYSGDSRHGTMRGHAIAAAEAIRGLGAFLDAGGRRLGG